MSKMFLGLFLSTMLLFSLVAYGRTPGNISTEENQSSKEENKEKASNPVRNTTTEKLIEMRDSKLWLNQKDLDKLSLDGEPYKLPEELLEIMNFSHVIINYPLLVFNTNNVYNLEEKELIFTAEDIILSLEECWGKTMGVNGVISYWDMELEPKDFNFIDNVILSPSKKKVAFSTHFYHIATFKSIVGIIDIEDNIINFVEGPSHGQVAEFSWSPDEDYFAYITTLGVESGVAEICIIDSNNLRKVVGIKSTELFEDKLNKEQVSKYYYTNIELSKWCENSCLDIKLKYSINEGEADEEITKSIEY